MAVDVSPAGAELLPVVARVHLESALFAYRDIFPADAPKPSYDEVLAQWRSGGSRALVAMDGTELVGVVLAGPDQRRPPVGHLARLYVRPQRWGQGIGGRLYAAALDHLRAEGFTEATLWVLERNVRVRAWYERLGWRATGERKSVYALAGIDDVEYAIGL